MIVYLALTSDDFPLDCSMRITPLTEREAILACEEDPPEMVEGLSAVDDARLARLLCLQPCYLWRARGLRVGDRVLVPTSALLAGRTGPQDVAWMLVEVSDD